MPSVLAIDLGTSGVKVALIDDLGQVHASASAPLTTTFTGDGGAEQDADVWWDAIGTCARAIVAQHDRDDVAAVAVTTQYMSIVAIDERGHPVTPVIMWMDGRGARHNRARLRDDPGAVELWLERHGLAPLGHDDQGHIAFLREERPDAYRRAAAFVEPVDALNARLTGRICATQTTAMPLMTVDNRTHGATAHDEDLVTRSGLDAAKLPPLIGFDEIVGQLTDDAARHLGLSTDVVVVPGTVDSITSGIGCGVVDTESVALLVGTTTVIVTNIDRKDADYDHDLVSVPSPLPGRWFVMAENGVGGRALEVGLQLLGLGFDDAAVLAASARTGSNGVLFQPWLAGSLAPASDVRLRGGFAGIGLDTNRADLARALYEGVALNAAWLLPHVAALADRRWDTIRMGGGGATSPFWVQVFADALGTTVERVTDPRNTNARGAALLAHAQLGHLAIDDIPSRIPVSDAHAPDGDAHAIYDRLLADHVDLHARLRAFYSERRRRQR